MPKPHDTEKQSYLLNEYSARIVELENENKKLRRLLGSKERFLLELRDALLSFQYKKPISPYKPKKQSYRSCAPAVFLWGDWHIGEVVDPHAINNINSYNYEIACRRMDELVTRFLEKMLLYGLLCHNGILQQEISEFYMFPVKAVIEILAQKNDPSSLPALVQAYQIARPTVMWSVPFNPSEVKVAIIDAVGKISRQLGPEDITKKRVKTFLEHACGQAENDEIKESAIRQLNLLFPESSQ